VRARDRGAPRTAKLRRRRRRRRRHKRARARLIGVIVATIEKANALVSRLLEDDALVDTLGEGRARANWSILIRLLLLLISFAF
jgi:hypothetical protein